MKTTKFFLMAALALTFAACSNDDNDIQSPAQPAKAEGITITATLAPKSGATTRAVSEGSDEIVADWAVNEHIAILYDKGGAQMADATIKSVDSETKSATIEFTVEDGTPDNTACTLVYPASAAKDDHTGVKDAATLLAAQDGTLNANLDVRVGEGTIQTVTPGLTVTTQPAAQYSIFKLTLGSAIDATHPLTIKDNSDAVITTVTPTSSKTEVFVALAPATSKYYKFSATTSENKIISKSSTATIAAGNYYQTTLACPALGDLYYSDGTYNATLQTGKTPIGVIAYLGTDAFSENGTTVNGSTFAGHGLVLCLRNAASGKAWSILRAFNFSGHLVVSEGDLKRTTNVSGYTNTATLTADAETAANYPAAKAAKEYTTLAAPTGTTGWFLPSAQQWVKMQTGLGALDMNDITWNSYFDTSNTAVGKWENAIQKAGSGNYDSMTPGTSLLYWSSSESTNDNNSAEYAVSLVVHTSNGLRLGRTSKTTALSTLVRVRPVLAF